MKYQELKQAHDNLELEVLLALRNEIENSEIQSQTVDTKCVKVNVFDYVELVIIHGELTFIDSRGLHYGIYTECNLEDLIDILMTL